MNPRVFLVATVHEIAISTEFAITARASQEADTNALTKRPALDARAKGIDPPDHFVPRDARPADWKGGFHRAGIRVADTARLDANAHLTGARIDQRFHYGFEFSRFRYLDCAIHCAHIASLYAHVPQHFRYAQRHLGMKHSRLRAETEMPSCNAVSSKELSWNRRSSALGRVSLPLAFRPGFPEQVIQPHVLRGPSIYFACNHSGFDEPHGLIEYAH